MKKQYLVLTSFTCQLITWDLDTKTGASLFDDRDLAIKQAKHFVKTNVDNLGFVTVDEVFVHDKGWYYTTAGDKKLSFDIVRYDIFKKTGKRY